MYSDNKYEAIVWAKKVMLELSVRGVVFTKENVTHMFRNICSSRRISIHNKIGLRTVLESGTWVVAFGYPQGLQFNMPATSCCLENWDAIKREFERCDLLSFFIYDGRKYRYDYM